MRRLAPLLAIMISTLLAYVISGDPYFGLSVFIMGALMYVVAINPSIGGPLFYGLLGFLGGFLLALLLGLTVFKNSRIGSYALFSLLIIGPAIALFIGKKNNYRLWFSLKP
ncbi:hypothetical protein [Thermococcus sp.]|uniref:hypothetical protein n=1 Tax=Thermococcus sp. TaxID=35749 RepID=UPI002612A107|nr:hypothetical protein [Thermococcus sp.]